MFMRKYYFAVATLSAAMGQALAQDVMTVAADHYKVRVDNSFVRVVENTLAPGEKDPVHTHAAGWYYVTKPGKMKVVHADGKSDIWDAKAGEAGWMEAEGPHSSENIGRATMGFILVEVKSAASTSVAQATEAAPTPGTAVDVHGQSAKVKIDQLIGGHLTELNGHYKLRVSEVTWSPGGGIGPHHHAGPGIRCVMKGELTYVERGEPHVYRANDCFYESGDVVHTAGNEGKDPVVLLNFELLPAAWAKGSAIAVPH